MQESLSRATNWPDSSFRIGVDRKHKLKWLFPQEKGSPQELEESTCIPTLLLTDQAS